MQYVPPHHHTFLAAQFGQQMKLTLGAIKNTKKNKENSAWSFKLFLHCILHNNIVSGQEFKIMTCT